MKLKTFLFIILILLFLSGQGFAEGSKFDRFANDAEAAAQTRDDVGLTPANISSIMAAPGVINKFQLDHNVELLNADRTVLITDKPIQWYDANGVDRNITLPAEASSTDLIFTFYNDSDGAGEDLVIRDDTPTTLITIGPGQGIRVSCDGTSWKIWYNGIYYDSIADIVKINDRLDLTDGTDTSIIKHVEEPGLGGRLTIGLDETARSMVICDAGDVDTDFGLSVQSSPTLYIFDAALSNKLTINNNALRTDVGISLALTSGYRLNVTNNLDISSGNAVQLRSGSEIEFIDDNAEQSWLYIEPKINQSATAAYNGLKIKITETSTGNATTGEGGGTNNLILAGTSTNPDTFVVDTKGVIYSAETTTPTAKADTGALYTKTDNVLYFQDGAGVEHAVSPIEENYGEAYIYNNAVVTVIETADTPIALRQISSGLVHNFTFDAGGTGAVTAYSDYSGTVAGTVNATDVGHGLVTGDIITIRGTTNYNGVFEITRIDDNEFYFTDTWVADDGASDWDQGASLTYTGAATAIHSMSWQMSTFPAAGCTVTFMMYKNTTPLTKSTAERKFAINDLGSTSSSCVCSIANGDVIWLTVQSDDTANITNKHGEFNLRRL